MYTSQDILDTLIYPWSLIHKCTRLFYSFSISQLAPPTNTNMNTIHFLNVSLDVSLGNGNTDMIHFLLNVSLARQVLVFNFIFLMLSLNVINTIGCQTSTNKDLLLKDKQCPRNGCIPCQVCPKLEANDCNSKELVLGASGCMVIPAFKTSSISSK